MPEGSATLKHTTTHIQTMAGTSVSHSTTKITAATKHSCNDTNSQLGLHSTKDLHLGIRRSYSDHQICYPKNRVRAAASPQPQLKSSRSVGSFSFQLPDSVTPSSVQSFLSQLKTSKGSESEVLAERRHDAQAAEHQKKVNWVERIMEIGRHWRHAEHIENAGNEEDEDNEEHNNDDNGCDVDYNSEEDDCGSSSMDRESFSKLLFQVPCSDAELFSKLAFLSNMAYFIPKISTKDLRSYCGLRLVTSSLEKKAEAAAIKAKATASLAALASPSNTAGDLDKRHALLPIAYNIAASAASYLQSHTKNILAMAEPHQDSVGLDSSGSKHHGSHGRSSPTQDKAVYVTTSTITAVVAAGEKEKQQAAMKLQSLHSAPCEWFVCDDLGTQTRYFTIQGSESLASWQANLFFEPTKFEGLEASVHRGIYEAAKGIYEQLMPEIMDHLNRHGERAKFRFTGHSLGGSIALLVNMMLLARKVIRPSAVLPIVTFGSPFVFCEGRQILDQLGLDESQVHSVMMHRDIVPRALSCNYPDQVAQVLKKLNHSFRTHSCLTKKKLMYAPLGRIFILQPDEKLSPYHSLLPPGKGLYALGKPKSTYPRSALRAFLNSPHPLETLSDPTAYGMEGTILRDHHSRNYMKALYAVTVEIRQSGNLQAPRLASAAAAASPNTSRLAAAAAASPNTPRLASAAASPNTLDKESSFTATRLSSNLETRFVSEKIITTV